MFFFWVPFFTHSEAFTPEKSLSDGASVFPTQPFSVLVATPLFHFPDELGTPDAFF